jgi:hypothetical protein
VTDVRQQLTEALDEAERIARAATPGPWEAENEYRMLKGCRCMSCWEDEPYAMAIHEIDARGEDSSPILPPGDAIHIARWDPATVLRLVERDRKLLAASRAVEGVMRRSQYGYGELDCLTRMLDDAAAFWLGTPEADHG